jgi:hypothetical protein
MNSSLDKMTLAEIKDYVSALEKKSSKNDYKAHLADIFTQLVQMIDDQDVRDMRLEIDNSDKAPLFGMYDSHGNMPDIKPRLGWTEITIKILS